MDGKTLKQSNSDSNSSALRQDEGLTSWEQYREAVIREAAMLQTMQPYGSGSSVSGSYYAGSYITGSYAGSSGSVGSSCCNADLDLTRLGYGLRLI